MRLSFTNLRYMSQRSYTSLLKKVVTVVVLAVSPWVASPAYDLSTYAESSALAKGRWVKISVDKTGLYILSNSTLRSMGFSDPSRVRIHGYGGRRIDDIMSASTFIDDLPQTPCAFTDAGIVFYALGPDEWVRSTNTSYYHIESNPYSLAGYYFVTESDDEAVTVSNTTGESGAGSYTPATTSQGRTHYERDLTMATEAGPLTVGEDFRFTPTRKFNFSMPGRVENTTLWLECQFVSRHVGIPSQLTFKADGNDVPAVSTDRIAATSDSHYVHASIGTTRHSFIPKLDMPERMELTVTHSCEGVVHQANLDYITINYTRDLTLPAEGFLEFWANSSALSLGGVTNETVVWDVTDPYAITRVNTEFSNGSAVWRPSVLAMRSYVAWRPGAQLPEPKVAGNVANQNLHAEALAADMVIIAPTQLLGQARRIAALHEKTDSMTVFIADAAKVYNEFSSGQPDVSGLRKFLKMVYDRSAATTTPLKYALLLGRTTLDNREIASSTRALGYCTLPAWVNRKATHSMSDNDGLSTDDFIALLGDNSGKDLGLDDLSIAVGRIPMTSDADGASIVDKLYQYVNKSKRSNWKNRILVLADDEDQGVHLRQAEAMVRNFQKTPAMQHIIDKVYLDAYTLSSGVLPDARREMFRALEDGVTWWFYTGHANNHSWTGEGQLTYTDINSMYLRNLPFVVASTCDFLRWDSETTSGGEIMYKERNGGAIGMISATRPVYISDNGFYLESLGRNLLARDENGRFPTAGEVYRRSKNNILNSLGNHTSNSNRLRFVFMGDPAMRIVTPDPIVELLTINGEEVDIDRQLTIAAMSNATITGRITDPAGNTLTDFNGVVTVELYDALTSVTTLARGDNGKEEVFDRHGDKLYAGSTTVSEGLFTMHIAMPGMVADNFRTATMSMYAAANNSDAEAVGLNTAFYVYGYDEPETPDTTPPVIDNLYLNHSGFTSGDRVNSSPMLIASVSDNVGINLSNAGVGHQMTITLDGKNTYTDVSSFYTPATDGSPSGTINYSLENLTEGAHTLRLRVFDTSGNAASAEVELFVDDTMSPRIFEVFSDVNPASEAANFYVRHDRPENIVEVWITVYNLLGQPVWTGSSKGMSDNDLSSPVTWDLTDMTGRRVQRGIYLYRASITTDSNHYESASQRIAVTAP